MQPYGAESFAMQQEVQAALTAPYEVGQRLADPNNHIRLELLLAGAFEAAKTEAERQELRHVVLDSLISSGLAEYKFTRFPRVHRLLGKAVTNVTHGRIFTFPKAPLD